MKDMKKNIIILVVGMLMVCLPALATNPQPQEWQSTSVMKTSGSTYAPLINDIGAQSVYQMAKTTTTTEPYSPSGRRKSKENPSDPGATDDPSSPVGNTPWLLMMLLGAGYFSVKVIRKKSH